jgi:hypothetical protein
MRDFLETVSRAFAAFVLEIRPEGIHIEFADLLPGKVIVEVKHLEHAKIPIREWTVAKEVPVVGD